MPRVAAVCPPAPVLVPQLTGNTEVCELEGLRRAAQEAVEQLVAAAPRTICVLAPGGAEVRGDSAGGTLASLGADVRAGGPDASLGVAHTLGAWLLDRAGWAGPRTYRGDVPPDADAVLVMADGSACRSRQAPGHHDERAEAFDGAIEQALATGDAAALTAIDRALAAELLCSGAPALAALAEAFDGSDVTARLLHADAPLGVGYWVALWRRA